MDIKGQQIQEGILVKTMEDRIMSQGAQYLCTENVWQTKDNCTALYTKLRAALFLVSELTVMHQK